MRNYKIGQRVRVGGSKGSIMTIVEIKGTNMTLVDNVLDPCCTFYYQLGDCSLIPVQSYEQLSLF